MKINFLIVVLLLLFSCQSESNDSESPKKNNSVSNERLTENVLDSLLSVYPDSLDLIIKHADLMFEKNQWSKFMQSAAKAYSKDSSQTEVKLLYAKALLNLQDNSAQDKMNSKRIYSSILQKDSSNAEALLGIAQVYGIDNIEECMRYTNASIKSNPTYRDAYILRGSIFRRLGDEQKMLAAWEKALNLDPNWVNGYIYIGSYYLNVKDPICVEYYTTCLELYPNNPDFIFNLAYAKGEFGKEREAIDLYKKMISVDPSKYEAYCQIGQILQKKYNALDSALSFYSNAIDLDPNHIDAFVNTGLIYEEKKNYSLALKNYAQALSIDIRSRDPFIMTEEDFKENQNLARTRANILKKKL